MAAVKMCTEILGVIQLAHDWGVELEAKVYVDSSAAIGAVNRRGNGKLRHVKVGMMWIQEKVEEGELDVRKVKGTENPADMMTKNLPEGSIGRYMEALGQEHHGGRAKESLKI